MHVYMWFVLGNRRGALNLYLRQQPPATPPPNFDPNHHFYHYIKESQLRPMAPARSTRRNQHEQSVSLRSAQPDPSPVEDGSSGSDLFLEPMMGTPLTVYIEKEVEDRDTLVELILVGHPSISYSLLLTFARNTEVQLHQDTAGRHTFLVSANDCNCPLYFIQMHLLSRSP